MDLIGKPVEANQEGFLIVRRPWPSMARTFWQRIEGLYMTGDAARRDEDGYFWILGRIDDVMNVSGHRLSTMEIESALVRHPVVAEAAVMGKPHEITGQAVACFVTLKKGHWNHHELAEELRKWVAHEIGGFGKPSGTSLRTTRRLPIRKCCSRRRLRVATTSNSPSTNGTASNVSP